MDWKPWLGFLIGNAAILLGLKFRPQTEVVNPPFTICHEYDAPSKLCVSWTNFWSNYIKDPDSADLEGHAKKCLAAGKAVGTSDFTADFDEHRCLDSCPDGSDHCLIGKLADPKLNRPLTEEELERAAKSVRAAIEAASAL